MKHTRLTFAAFVVLMVGLGSSDSLRGIFSPVFSSHFALSATQLGLIVTVSYIGNLVFLLVGGNVIERFEKKKALLAQKGMPCRQMDKVMAAFAEIGLSPVTIGKRDPVLHIKNIYSHMESIQNSE